MMISVKCPTCKQAVPTLAMQKFENLPGANDALASLTLEFIPEDRNHDLNSLLKVCTQLTEIRLETAFWWTPEGKLAVKITPVPVDAEKLAAAMPGSQASAKVANLMSSTRDQLVERCIELRIEFYPKAKEPELRALIQGEEARIAADPTRRPKGKPEPVGAK